MKSSKKIKIFASNIGPDYYNQLQEKLTKRGIDCEIIMYDSFCLLYSACKSNIQKLRELLRKENDEIIVLIPSTTEVFLEEPDLSILFSAYKSWYNPNKFKIIPYIWQSFHSTELMEAPELQEIKWRKKPELSVGFLGNSYESKKIVRLSSYLPRFLKNQILRGRHLKYLYNINHNKIATLMAWMPCYFRLESIRKLETTTLKKDILKHSYTASSAENKNYQNHLKQNTYILCPRGYENFSIRFYETLAYGRIPVLIDTDMVLPPNINWDEICLRVSYENLSNLETIIRNDYENKTENEFIARQEKALEVVENLRNMVWLEDIVEEIAAA